VASICPWDVRSQLATQVSRRLPVRRKNHDRLWLVSRFDQIDGSHGSFNVRKSGEHGQAVANLQVCSRPLDELSVL
jgi:hypothetical protein